jgi:hypothetical protein
MLTTAATVLISEPKGSRAVIGHGTNFRQWFHQPLRTTSSRTPCTRDSTHTHIRSRPPSSHLNPNHAVKQIHRPRGFLQSTPHTFLSALMIHVDGQKWFFSKLTSRVTISSRSRGSDTRGPQMKIVWQIVMEIGTVSGELLPAPQIMRACSRMVC